MGEWWGREDLVSQRPLRLRDEDHRPLLQALSSTAGHPPGNVLVPAGAKQVTVRPRESVCWDQRLSLLSAGSARKRAMDSTGLPSRLPPSMSHSPVCTSVGRPESRALVIDRCLSVSVNFHLTI